jgi:hypothetical protein
VIPLATTDAGIAEVTTARNIATDTSRPIARDPNSIPTSVITAKAKSCVTRQNISTARSMRKQQLQGEDLRAGKASDYQKNNSAKWIS